MRTVTVTAAILAILFSALARTPELDHSVLPTQVSITSDTDLDLANDGHAISATETDCHIGYSCMLAISPGNDLALTRSHSTPEFFLFGGYLPSVAGYLPFQPPRTFSLV